MFLFKDLLIVLFTMLVVLCEIPARMFNFFKNEEYKKARFSNEQAKELEEMTK